MASQCSVDCLYLRAGGASRMLAACGLYDGYDDLCLLQGHSEIPIPLN